MSWPGEDWTVGLTGHVLLKVQQLQAQNEKLTKERQQRQLQLDNSEVALHKQRKKYEEVRVELAAVQRELGGVREAAQTEVRTREHLTHDLQVKKGQVHSLEGQLESAKNLTQSLTQEIKRLEAELEKVQKGNGSGDSMLFSAPCWSMSSPRDHNGGFSAEGDSKAQPVRQQLQFGDTLKPVVEGATSPFPQQPQQSPPLRHHVRQSEASTPSSVFPWERNNLWSTPKGRSAASVSSSDVIVENNDSGIEETLRKEIDALRVQVSDLQRVAQLESERLKDIESRLTQAHRDLSTKEQNLTRTQDELTRAQSRITQETDRAQAAEQRVKQLQEELKCQRQNAETSRCNAEQRRKDMEREHHRELLEQQRERQALEKQHQQEINRLNQEIQQARTLHNTLQAQHDKVCLQKQGLERDLGDVKGKLKNTETDLRESQKRESQTEAKLMEALREGENFTVFLGQMKKQEKSLQEEVKRLTNELAEALHHIKELQAKLVAPPQPLSAPHFSSAGDYLSSSIALHHDCSPPYHPSTQKIKAPQTALIRKEDKMNFSSCREPGEGIDSENIRNYGPKESQKIRGKGVITHQSRSVKLSETDVDTSLMEQDTGVEDMDTDLLTYDSTSGTVSKSESDVTCNLQGIAHQASHNVQKHDSASLKDLKKENAELRDELRDVKYELQKRLEDLESQRRAEAEARTKLKQFSHKNSTQTEQQRVKALELKDSVTKLETELEQEKKESTKLRAALDVLEREAEKRQKEKERDQEEATKLKEVLAEMGQKETSMEDKMRRLKIELEDLQLKLKQEREEREQEQKLIQREEVEGFKTAQLQEELDNLGRFGIKEKLSKDNVPVSYLQLENHLTTIKAPMVENKDFGSSPDMLKSTCDSVNLQNTLVCKETRAVELIMDLGVQTGLAETAQTNTEEKTSAAEGEGTDLENTAFLVLEIERLRSARDQEIEKAKLAQRKLEDLQTQVTSQTKHLTLAFESQSKHIEKLLGELHNKDCTIQRQGEELQKCQETITVLQEAKQNRENVVSSEASTHQELSTEISRDLSCDSVISNTSISDHEMFNDNTLQILKNSQPTVQLPVGHSVSQTITQTNTIDVSDKLQVEPEVCKSHEFGVTSATHCECASFSAINSEGQKLSKVTDKNSRETKNCTTTTSHLQDQSDQSEVLNLQHNSPEHSTDISELEKIWKELHEARIQLHVLKNQNEALCLQGSVTEEELLFVKGENKELKSKLRHFGQDICADSNSTQNAALPLMNIKSNYLNQHLQNQEIANSAPSGKEEPVVYNKDPEDNEMEGTEKSTECEYEHYSTAEVHSLQVQIQALQDQIQDLSEQNRTQVEELELWKLSAMGEMVGSSSPSIMLRQFELVLPCLSTKLPVEQTRATTYHCTAGITHLCRSEDGNDQTNLLETIMTHAVSESQGPDEDLIIGNESLTTVKQAEECESSSVIHSHESPSVCMSDAMISNTKNKLSDLQIKPAQQIALVSPEYQTNMPPARAISQGDALINLSISGQYQTKVINSKPIAEPCENNPSQNPDLRAACNEIKTMETVALDKHKVLSPKYYSGDATDKQNRHATIGGSVLSENESNSAHGQRAEIIKFTGGPNSMEVKDVQSVSTQTEGSRELGLEVFSDSPLTCSLIQTSTQTDDVWLETEDNGKETSNSPPLSLNTQPVTNPLLLSKAFPMSNPAHLAERIRQNRSRMSAAYDDTEYEPYGLPDVVMKGFADIPSGPACPYVLRRGLLGTDAMPLPLREATPQEESEDVEP